MMTPSAYIFLVRPSPILNTKEISPYTLCNLLSTRITFSSPIHQHLRTISKAPPRRDFNIFATKLAESRISYRAGAASADAYSLLCQQSSRALELRAAVECFKIRSAYTLSSILTIYFRRREWVEPARHARDARRKYNVGDSDAAQGGSRRCYAMRG